MPMPNGDFGKELILDIEECNVTKFNRVELDLYFKELCELIDMEKCDRYWWDDLDTPEDEKETELHLVGISAIQFIKTSNITIHTLDLLGKAYLNIFSCKDFDENVATDFTLNFLDAKLINMHVVRRI